MADYVNLIGAEEVSRAASSISTSAGEMRQAAGYIDESLARFIRQFEELVTRMEAVAVPVNRNICVVCKASLLPHHKDPPHCLDCIPTDDDCEDWWNDVKPG